MSSIKLMLHKMEQKWNAENIYFLLYKQCILIFGCGLVKCLRKRCLQSIRKADIYYS